MFSQDIIFKFVSDAFDELLIKRVKSLTNAVQGCIHNCSLAIHAIGDGLSQAAGIKRKHAIKQVDRLLSNEKLHIESLLIDWVKFIVADKKKLLFH